jgi:hypothetical protein
MISKKVAVVVAATVVAVLAGATAAIAMSRTGTSTPDPASRDAPVVHRSKQDPDEVQKYWTPERIREAQQNMRNNTSARD